MASPITIRFIDAKGNPVREKEENRPVAEISESGKPSTAQIFLADKETGLIVTDRYQDIPQNVPLTIRGYGTRDFSPYPRGSIEASPGDTVTIRYLRKGEMIEETPISFLGGLLIGAVVAGGAYILVRFIIKPGGAP